MFNLIQTVDKPTHRCVRHILDWILHRRDDEILQTTHVSHELTCDHFTIVCGLDLLVPRQTISMILSAEQLDSILRSLLDKHASITTCKISEKKCAPW